LKRLALDNNRLTVLPSQLAQCTALVELSLHHNTLFEIELGALASLTRLERLDVSNNQLATLPKDIGNLRRLEVLHVVRF
jgi:Leucine-rich repeat (LRR) protein